MYESERDMASLDGPPSFDDPVPNLEVIYQAFGEQADLYKDVLQVKPTATAEQIQMAYFDRRSELFALLASIDSEEEQDDITASHRFHAERKMDAVVMAVRILGDPELRQEYDDVILVSKTRKLPKEPPSGSSVTSRSSSTREPDGVYAGLAGSQGDAEPPSPRARSTRSPKRRSPKRRSRRVSPSDTDTLEDAKLPSSHSSEEIIKQHQDQRHVLDFSFASPSTGSKGSKGSSNKSKKSHKKKHQDNQHQHSSYLQNAHHHATGEPSIDQETLTNTFDEDRTFHNLSTDLGDDATLDSKRTFDDLGTIGSQSTTGDWTRDSRQIARGGTSTLSHVTNTGIVSRIQEEVAGTVEDTLVSFEQVLNVFTLQERDILAVMGRIDKAKRQLRKRR